MTTLREAAESLLVGVERLADLDVNCSQQEDMAAWIVVHSRADELRAAIAGEGKREIAIRRLLRAADKLATDTLNDHYRSSVTVEINEALAACMAAGLEP